MSVRIVHLLNMQRLLALHMDAISAHIGRVPVALLPSLTSDAAAYAGVHFLKAEVSPLLKQRSVLFAEDLVAIPWNLWRDGLLRRTMLSRTLLDKRAHGPLS